MEIKLKIKRAGDVNSLIWILTVVLISSIYIFTSETFGAIILFVLSAAIFVIYAIENNNLFTFKLERMHWHIIAFGGFCLFSAIWALNSSAAVSRAMTIFEILVCVSILYLAYQDVDDLWCLANAIKCSGFVVALYSFYFYGLNTIRRVIEQDQRLDNEYANVNGIAMLCSICVVIAFYELLFRRFNFVSLIMCMPCIIVIAATASRKAFVEVGIGIALVIIFRYASRNFFRMLIRIIAIGAVVGLIFWVLYSIGLFDGMMKRMQGLVAMFTGSGNVDNSSAVRNAFTRIGLQQFFETPILGIGMGSSGELLISAGERYTYLHNNFVEMLCCGGVVGFAIYYSMSLDCIWQFIRYRLRDPMSKLCIILLLDNLVMDYGQVSYYSKITYIFLLLFFLEARKLQQINSVKVKYKSAKSDLVRERVTTSTVHS